MKDLKDWEFSELVTCAVTHFVEQVFGGKTTLNSALHWVCDVAARWGASNYKPPGGHSNEQLKAAEAAALRILRKSRSRLSKDWLVEQIFEVVHNK